MTDAKIEPLLHAAIAATPMELAASPTLSAGFEPASGLWEVIIRFTGSFETILSSVEVSSATELLEGYGILTLSPDAISRLAALPQITYIEKPKRLYFELLSSGASACVSSLQSSFPFSFTGRDVLVAIIDSGIDYTHPDFIDAEGKSRILALWDQTIPSDPAIGTYPPPGYVPGTLYDNDLLNRALASPVPTAVCPSIDLSGHGTHVAGIAAGNGRASGGLYRGVANEAKLLVVKLQAPDPFGFPSTGQLMQAVDFCIRHSILLGLPLAINLSFGNSYGSHSGSSLLETYLDQVLLLGKTALAVGTGNEGAASGHVSASLSSGAVNRHEFTIGEYQPSLNLQLWQYYWDEFLVGLEAPNGSTLVIPQSPGAWRFTLEGTRLYVYVGQPSPYSIFRETYIEFLPESRSALTPGLWALSLRGGRILGGDYQLWMPVGSTRSPGTRFLAPSPELTLTIPSTAHRVISVGAYDSRRLQPAEFSGRGFTWDALRVKPELCAPGVDIISCAPGGGYDTRSGTSMATPFVTGSCAALMQWGISDGNDPFLYGEKLKAYLIRGANPIKSVPIYPSNEIGWGTLCLRNSINP